MGMSTTIVGIRDLDGKFKQMMDVKKACDRAGIDYPEEVHEYFEYRADRPEEELINQMNSTDLKKAVKKLDVEYSDVYEVDLSKITKDVKKIQFRVSY